MRALADADVDLGWAQQVTDEVPYPSLELSRLAVTLTTRIVAGFTSDTPVEDRAWRTWQHAVRLSEVGRRQEALTASRECLALDRKLARHDRRSHLPGLAASVGFHSLQLAEAGQRDEALTTSQEAVTLYRELTTHNRDAHLPNLARSLWGVGHVALMVGEITDESIQLTAEGVRYFEELAAVQPEVFEPRRRAAADTLARLRRAADADPDAAAQPE